MTLHDDLENFDPVPDPIRRAYIRTYKSADDPARYAVDGPARDSLAAPEEIAAMATVIVHDLSPKRPSSPRARSSTLRDAPTGVEHHRLRCAVCKHRDRAAIEEAFLQWRSARWITDEFRLPGRTSIYRHAHAFNLFSRRGSNLRHALEHIIEEAERVRPNAIAVVEAIRTYARLDDNGRWTEPPSTHVVVPGVPANPPPLPPSLPAPVQSAPALPAPRRAASPRRRARANRSSRGRSK